MFYTIRQVLSSSEDKGRYYNNNLDYSKDYLKFSNHTYKSHPIQVFFDNNNKKNTNNLPTISQQPKGQALYEKKENIDRDGGREQITSRGQELKSSPSSALSERNLQRQQQRHESTSVSVSTIMEIDLISTHIFEYLTWREQLHLRTVSKLWQMAYVSATTRLLVVLEQGQSSSVPSSSSIRRIRTLQSHQYHHRIEEYSSIPRVLQPSQLERTQHEISWNGMIRLCHSAGGGGGGVVTKRRLSRLDIYMGDGGNKQRDMQVKSPRIRDSHISTILEELQKIRIHNDPFNMTCDCSVRELRLFHVKCDGSDLVTLSCNPIHQKPRMKNPRMINPQKISSSPSSPSSSSSFLSSVKHLMIRRQERSPTMTMYQPKNPHPSQCLPNSYNDETTTKWFFCLRTILPNLQLLDMDGMVFDLRKYEGCGLREE